MDILEDFFGFDLDSEDYRDWIYIFILIVSTTIFYRAQDSL